MMSRKTKIYFFSKLVLHRSRVSGYTMIELLIVVAIMFILFTVGFGNYRDFQKRQYFEGEVRSLMADLVLAREMALSGVIPDPTGPVQCDGLVGYVVRIHRTQERYRLSALCSSIANVKACYNGGTWDCVFDDKDIGKDNNIAITITPGGGNIRQFYFKSLGRGVVLITGGGEVQTTVTITLNYDSLSKTITVTSSGDISEKWN